MSNLWKQRVGFVGLFGVYYIYTLHANLMDSRPLAAPSSTLYDYQPSAGYPLTQESFKPAAATPTLLSLGASNSMPLKGSNENAAAAGVVTFPTGVASSTSVVHHGTGTFNATNAAEGAVAAGGGAWSGTYKCYDYGETFAASFLCHVDAFQGRSAYAFGRACLPVRL